MDISTNAAFFYFALLAIVSLIVELASIYYIDRRLRREHNWLEQRGTVGEQFGDWLLYSDAEDQPTNLDVLAGRVAHAMVVGVNSQVAGKASGDARRQKMVDNKLFNAMATANPEMKLVTKALDKLGLGELNDPELIPYVLDFFRKNKIVPSATSNNPRGW